MTGYKESNQTYLQNDPEGNVVEEFNQTLITWSNYINELFSDNRPNIPQLKNQNKNPSILKSEIKQTIVQVSWGKIIGLDEING